MKSLCAFFRRSLLLFAALASAVASAMPRPATPPLPERQLATWRFDDAAWIARPTSNALAAQHLALAESWSGYALEMSGEQPSLLALPLLSATGKPNVAANAGTVRFWFAPSWSSKSVGGSGPGEWARLLEVGHPPVVAAQEKFWVALATDPTGDVLTLAARGEHAPPVYLQVPVQWQAGQWHQVHIVYSPTNTLLVVDGALVAATENGIAWPGPAHWPELAFSLGSGLDGEDIAHGQFEELTTFAFPLSLEYMAWHYQQYASVAAMGPVTEQERLLAKQQRSESELTSATTTSSEPPPAPGPGGGGGGGVTIPPSPPGLKLTRPLLAGVSLATTLAEADTNSAYDIFQKLGLQPTNTWSRVAMGDIGQTNFTLSVPSTNRAFFIAAAVVDSDFDGLPDAYEELVLGTSPLSADTNGDGVPDGGGDRNGNGLPDYVDYNGLTRAVIYATRTNAFEGGQAGEVTVRLPSSAPTNNTRVVLHLGGLADYDGDYWLAKLDGTRVTNDLFFVIGEREIRLQVHASNDTVQASIPRKVSLALAESANYQLDPQRADVTLIDNDLPAVTAFANDHKAGEPKGTNLDPGAFILRRDGMLTNALTVNFAVSGSATGGSDYTNLTSPIVMPMGSNVITIPVNPIHDTNYEGDENVIITLQSSASYTVDAQGASATVTLADNDLPLVYFVGTDLVATEYDNLKPATVTLRRTGNPAQPLTVPLSISGTASTNDYQALANSITFPVGASNAVINVRPLTDVAEEQTETVVLTLKGSLGYEIGASNSVTVLIDDNFATRYERVQLKQAAIYDPTFGIDSPFVGEIRRFGRSSQTVNIPFIVYTNTQQGARITSFYRATGDVSGTNLVFPAFATKARLNLSAPVAVPRFAGGVDILFPTLSSELWSAFYQPTWQHLRFSVIETNVIEGGAVQGRVRVTRVMTAPVPVTVGIDLSGQAAPAGGPNPDHTLAASFLMTLATNATSVDATFTASVDTTLEGWETMIFAPIQYDPEIVFDYGVRYMAFIRENVANPEGLPQGDGDLDGLPDRWELANGLDPFTAGDDLLDPDKDGLTTGDEFAYNTNPKQNDSDGDGENDFFDAHKIGSPDEFLPVRLVTHDTGKVPNAMMNCAECHTTQLRVGDFSQISRLHNSLTDRTIYLRKGTNYPIHLNRVVRHLPRPNAAVGSPTLNTAKYTANIVPHQDDAPRAFVIQDPQSRLGTNKLASNFPADPSVAIGSLIVPKIEVTFTNLSGNTPLDANTNWGGGVRVFPDALNPNDFLVRNRVRVRVRTIPPLPNQRVLLKSFDVDDPTPARIDDKFVVDSGDATGERGDDNFGIPSGAQLAASTLTLDSQGEALTDCAVSWQPGNNFRVAAVLETPGAQAHLDQLQVTNAGAPLYVTADTNAVRGFVGGLSPMLTVWRKLHLEFDSMVSPPLSGSEAAYVNGTISSAKINFPVPGRSHFGVVYENLTGERWDFERGKLEITGTGTYPIRYSTTLGGGNQRTVAAVEVDGIPTGTLVGRSVKIFDDDDQYLNNDSIYLSSLNLPSPPLSVAGRIADIIAALQPEFGDTYIFLVDSHRLGWNSQTNVAFKRHAAANTVSGSIFDNGNLQLKGTDRSEFWAFSVVFGYQPTAIVAGIPLGFFDDGDPNEETALSGGTPETNPFVVPNNNRPFGFSVVFMESIREHTLRIGQLAQNGSDFTNSVRVPHIRKHYLDTLYGVVAHELGHAPGRQSEGTDHAEKGLMEEGAAPIEETGFTPSTIRRFRNAKSWTQ